MKIVTRSEWGARPPIKENGVTNQVPINTPTKDLILHHAGNRGIGASEVRRIQRFHQDGRGWADIAYHLLIDGDGTVYEGTTPGMRGAATYGQNGTSHAIAFLGNHSDLVPTQAALDSLVEAVIWGYDEGLWPREITGGHKDFRPTACPGSHLYKRIPTINQTIRDTPLSGEDDMALTDDDIQRIWGFQSLRDTQQGRPINMHQQMQRISDNAQWLVVNDGDDVETIAARMEGLLRSILAEKADLQAEDVIDALARRIAGPS